MFVLKYGIKADKERLPLALEQITMFQRIEKKLKKKESGEIPKK